MISLHLHHLLINSLTPTISTMNLNRKLLQQQQDPFHPIIPPTVLHPINESPPITTTATTAEENNRRPFNSNTSPFDTSMALTILVLLTALFFMSFFSFYIRRFSAANDDHHHTRRNNRGSTQSLSSTSATTTAAIHRGSKGLDPEIIKSLPTFPYGGDAKHRIDCSICLSEFEEGETVKLISYCRHGFHPCCIDTWLTSHVSCPLCRSTQLFGEVGLGAGEYSVGDVETIRSTASDGIDEIVGPGNVRRTCSFSSLIRIRERLSLPRSNSF